MEGNFFLCLQQIFAVTAWWFWGFCCGGAATDMTV